MVKRMTEFECGSERELLEGMLKKQSLLHGPLTRTLLGYPMIFSKK